MNPRTQHQAAAQVAHLLRRSLPGSRKAVEAHIRRAGNGAALIWLRFQVGPFQWQRKHLRWLMEHALKDLSPSSRYDYWRSILKVIAALEKEADWLPGLQGPWLRPNGNAAPIRQTGRPPRMPGGRR